MEIWHVRRNTGTVSMTLSGHRRPWLRFLEHLGEMILAMVLGMVLLGIPYRAFMAAIGYSTPVEQFPEISALVMTFNMTLPMVAWMRYRGHRWERSVEMAAAMVVPTVALTILCVLGVIPHRTLSGAVMIVTLPAMIAVMLLRHADYTHPGMHRLGVSGPQRPRPV